MNTHQSTKPSGRTKPDYRLFREVNQPNRSRGLDFFTPGIKAFKPAGRHKDCEVRLLPGVDDSQLGNPDFLASVTGYRKADGSFDGFYVAFRAHPYWGITETGMLSPGSLRYLYPGRYTEQEMKDPIEDCYAVAKRNAKWRPLTEKRGSLQPVLGKATALVFMNALYRHSGRSWDQGILIMSFGCLRHLEQQLDMLQPAGDTRLHCQERYQKYFLGDVTDPQEGLVAKVLKADTSPASPFCLNYTTGRGYDVRRMPVDDDVLRRRVDFGADDWFKMPTPQQMVDVMVEDGFLPLELIKKACGNYANVPSR